MKEEALRKEWFLPEGKTYLGLLVKLARGHFLLEFLLQTWRGIELYSLLVSHRENVSFPQGLFESSLTVGIIPSQIATWQVIQKMTYSEKYLKYYEIYPRIFLHLVSRILLGELIRKPNVGFCRNLQPSHLITSDL